MVFRRIVAVVAGYALWTVLWLAGNKAFFAGTAGAATAAGLPFRDAPVLLGLLATTAGGQPAPSPSPGSAGPPGATAGSKNVRGAIVGRVVDSETGAPIPDAGVEVIEGVEETACRALIQRFAHWVQTETPFVTLKMAITLDGKLAARGGRSPTVCSSAPRWQRFRACR